MGDLFASAIAEAAFIEACELFDLEFQETLQSHLLNWESLENIATSIRMALHTKLGMARFDCPYKALAGEFGQYIDLGIAWMMENKQ